MGERRVGTGWIGKDGGEKRRIIGKERDRKAGGIGYRRRGRERTGRKGEKVVGERSALIG
jgi:hypothetical protein